jgi:tetratricopeptide (TPR) repeat protein
VNRFDEGEPFLTRTLDRHRRAGRGGEMDTLEVMRWTGTTYNALGRYAEGERLLRDALDALPHLSGNHSRERLMYRLSLGTSFATRGALDAAVDELTGCLAEWRNEVGAAEFPPALQADRHLAWVYLLQDNVALAAPRAEDNLRRVEPVMGEGHLFTLNGQRILARVRQLQGRYAEAQPLLVGALDGLRKFEQEDSSRIAATLGALGYNFVAEQKYADAERPLTECLKVWEKRLPHGGDMTLTMSRRSAEREVAFAKCALGACLTHRKQYTEAETLLTQGWKGLSPQPGFPEDVTPLAHRIRTEALGWLTDLYEHWGKPAEAEKWRKELDAAKAH